MSVALARGLSDRTGAAAVEPWPLNTPAEVRLDVRVDQSYARADGVFEFSGQYAVSSPRGACGSLSNGSILKPRSLSPARRCGVCTFRRACRAVTAGGFFYVRTGAGIRPHLVGGRALRQSLGCSAMHPVCRTARSAPDPSPPHDPRDPRLRPDHGSP